MTTVGKLELTVKISELPADVQTAENGWKSFEVDCDNRIVSISVKPKMFKKLEDTQATFSLWVAIAGKRGYVEKDEFVLEKAAIQVFERKPKV
ncbi:MAG: fertility inhibition FinO-like protein [Drouetiella hepatica Uher 2000/2452]|jgi:hypothetical protein|uniref:Fertility inhibition FinO-like protein n=1 Tax=Drouetiella hepatica Uher 2000/2452 TaxID=904376 RepID=A0A951QH22_9CYAN|nr:fertility inhibition FinO-like protein [Drouetiella hepatica Uher 2000/2452]